MSRLSASFIVSNGPEEIVCGNQWRSGGCVWRNAWYCNLLKVLSAAADGCIIADNLGVT